MNKRYTMKRFFSLSICLMTVAVIFAQRPLVADVSQLPNGLQETVANGVNCRGQVMNGLQEGVWASYHEGGLVSILQEFSHGKQNGLYIEMDRNGYVSLQAGYWNDQLNGTLYKYRMGGKPTLEENYKNGLLHGYARCITIGDLFRKKAVMPKA